MAQGTRSIDTLDVHVRSLLTRNAQRRESFGSASPFSRSGSFIFSSSFTEKVPNERHDSVSSSDWVKVEDIISTLESLAFHSRQGKRCCTCVIACYKVAQVRSALFDIYLWLVLVANVTRALLSVEAHWLSTNYANLAENRRAFKGYVLIFSLFGKDQTGIGLV